MNNIVTLIIIICTLWLSQTGTLVVPTVVVPTVVVPTGCPYSASVLYKILILTTLTHSWYAHMYAHMLTHSLYAHPLMLICSPAHCTLTMLTHSWYAHMYAHPLIHSPMLTRLWVYSYTHPLMVHSPAHGYAHVYTHTLTRYAHMLTSYAHPLTRYADTLTRYTHTLITSLYLFTSFALCGCPKQAPWLSLLCIRLQHLH